MSDIYVCMYQEQLKKPSRCFFLFSEHRPGLFHGVLAEVDEPVDEVEDPEGQREEDAGVFVYGTGACQHHVGWDGRALKEDGIAIPGSLGHRVRPSSAAKATGIRLRLRQNKQ